MTTPEDPHPLGREALDEALRSLTIWGSVLLTRNERGSIDIHSAPTFVLTSWQTEAKSLVGEVLADHRQAIDFCRRIDRTDMPLLPTQRALLALVDAIEPTEEPWQS